VLARWRERYTTLEGEEIKLTKVVPFLIEDELIGLGAIFEKVRDWRPLSIVDGRRLPGRMLLHPPAQRRLC
jgi:hypothetical protein